MTPSMTICSKNCSKEGGGMIAEKFCFVVVVVVVDAATSLVVPSLPLPPDVATSVDDLRHTPVYCAET